MSSCARISNSLLRPHSAKNPHPLNRTTTTLNSHRGLRMRSRNPADPTVPTIKRMRTIESMPFQTYQLALETIRKDRAEKLELIKAEREKIGKLLKYTDAKVGDMRIKSMMRYLEELRIKADINNPRVKFNFDNGIVGMHKPIYRYLADKKWREMRRPILMQRLTQMNVIPDVLPTIDPVVDVQVRFQGKDIRPGAFVESLRSERPPTFKIIPFTQGEMLCTVAVVDPDVPDIEKDSYKYRLHWLLTNIPISPSQTQATGTGSKPSTTLVPYLPPHVQKGLPYHRYSMFIFQQPGAIDVDGLGTIERDGFNLRSFQGKHALKAVGAFMWRGEWDVGTKEVMERHGLSGWDMMFVRAKD